MKQTLVTLRDTLRGAWLRNPTLRKLTAASVLVLLAGLLLGGVRAVMLLTGYLQLVFRAVLPGEPVENNVLQRVMAFTGGLTRMLFFTGMMIHAAWPLLLMAAALVCGLLIMRRGEQTGTEISLLPLLSGAGFSLLGLVLGVPLPMARMALSGALALTLLRLLLHGRQTLCLLRMRFHLV